eukprot:TRINITY_DN51884_c0_g1_i2.p1 TRINITY_DN51884_c0_g1~~TRINITY_DN51884_c0_g1_i2.p1  ORF type:complete len:367 (+),score=69.15 TRINITY_DN51884_c0_g1_i2:80-1180(+)
MEVVGGRRVQPGHHLCRHILHQYRCLTAPLRRCRLPRHWLQSWLLMAIACLANCPAAAGQAADGISLQRDDLLKLRASLGRIRDELGVMVSVLDSSLGVAGQDSFARADSPPAMPQRQWWAQPQVAPTPRSADAVPAAPPDSGALKAGRRNLEQAAAPAAAPTAVEDDSGLPADAFERVAAAAEEMAKNEGFSNITAASQSKESSGTFVVWLWAATAWSFQWLLFCLDVAIVVSMQLFLESIGKRRSGGGGVAKGEVARTGSAAQQFLAVISHEELLANYLTEHWAKLASGVGLAVLCRLPANVFGEESFVSHMCSNLVVMLRCMSVVMLALRDDMALPMKRKKKSSDSARSDRSHASDPDDDYSR